jgi:hypothetical protein
MPVGPGEGTAGSGVTNRLGVQMLRLSPRSAVLALAARLDR